MAREQDNHPGWPEVMAAVKRWIDEDPHHTQSLLGAEVARLEGLDRPYSQSQVSDWLKGTWRPGFRALFAMERVMGYRPGALSRLVGVLPGDATTMRSTREAVRNDPGLSERGRNAVLAVYEQLVHEGADGS